MKNVLVTGGAGFIGSNFVRYLLEAEPDVRIVNLDALTYAGSLENLKDLPNASHHTFVEGNICDRALLDDLFEQHKIDTVVHFAAESHVDRSITNPGVFVQTNVVGTFTLLEAARAAWIVKQLVPLSEVRFHHVSTDEVFGALDLEDPSFTEETPYAPRSPYAASKASSDHFVRAYNITYGLPVTITNCSNNYGPYQFPEKLIPLTILNAIQGKPLPIYGDGKYVRDWLYVTDHCAAIHQVIREGRVGETYAIGGDAEPNNLELVNKICEILDELLPQSPNVPHNKLMTFVADRAGHDRRYSIDIAKVHDELGWNPTRSLNTGLLDTIRWYLDNSEWISAVTNKSDFKQWIETNYTKRDGGKA
ncbi:MAG TPA: dTDP-glucose 4,6-dehydratase [Bellilinea sp.]|nr:dTDP-glucose 4,6-dehydratase [Bellilinea sp.]